MAPHCPNSGLPDLTDEIEKTRAARTILLGLNRSLLNNELSPEAVSSNIRTASEAEADKLEITTLKQQCSEKDTEIERLKQQLAHASALPAAKPQQDSAEMAKQLKRTADQMGGLTLEDRRCTRSGKQAAPADGQHEIDVPALVRHLMENNKDLMSTNKKLTDMVEAADRRADERIAANDEVMERQKNKIRFLELTLETSILTANKAASAWRRR